MEAAGHYGADPAGIEEGMKACTPIEEDRDLSIIITVWNLFLLKTK